MLDKGEVGGDGEDTGDDDDDGGGGTDYVIDAPCTLVCYLGSCAEKDKQT